MKKGILLLVMILCTAAIIFAHVYHNSAAARILIGNLPAASSVEISEGGIITITPSAPLAPEIKTNETDLLIIYPDIPIEKI